MPPHPEHDAFVGPFHGDSLQDSDEGRSHIAVVIPGRIEDANPESRDSGFASSMRPGMTTAIWLRPSSESCKLSPWNGPTKASCSGCGGMANLPPLSSY